MIHTLKYEIIIYFLKFHHFHKILYTNCLEELTVPLAKPALSFPLNSLSPSICMLGHTFFLLHNVRLVNYAETSGQSE